MFGIVSDRARHPIASQHAPILNALLAATVFSGVVSTALACTPTPGHPCLKIVPVFPPANVIGLRSSSTGKLKGWVDLHTHPMANLAFGGKLIAGGPDVGSLLPADRQCHHMVRATSEKQALGRDNPIHGGLGLDNPCGDMWRSIFIPNLEKNLYGAVEHAGAFGYSDHNAHIARSFEDWPVWNDLTHQKMYVDWIHRAWQGGLRVMVALTVNNKTLADLVRGTGETLPDDDKRSTDVQIREIKKFVDRHKFMQIAETPDELHRIVSEGKLAVIIGTEIDHIGDFDSAPNNIGTAKGVAPTLKQVEAEILRLHTEGVRYIFPIHLLDNAFGGSAAYVNLFDVSNKLEDGHPYNLVCASPHDKITYRYDRDPSVVMALYAFAKRGKIIGHINRPSGCKFGEKNGLGLTKLGKKAILYMMSIGMMIDVDHMSQKAVNDTLELAQGHVGFLYPTYDQIIGRGFQPYPLFSGHNVLRGTCFRADQQAIRTAEGYSGRYKCESSERQLTAWQYKILGRIHGMAGVGTANLNAKDWLTAYNRVIHAMTEGLPGNCRVKGGGGCFPHTGGSIIGGFGTDTNGLAMGIPPRPGSNIVYNASFPQERDPQTGKTWNYNYHRCGSVTIRRDLHEKICGGVANYGMLWDFLKDVQTLPGGKNMISHFDEGAQYFYDTWEIIRNDKGNIHLANP